MSGRLTLTIIALLLAATLNGCKKDQAEPEKTSKPATAKRLTAEALPPAAPLVAPQFLSTPIETQVIETTNEALPTWKKFAHNRPLLAILAQEPGMVTIPPEKIEEALTLLRDADAATLTRRTGVIDPNPVFLPSMSVGAALDAGWLSGVVWVFPSSTSPDKIDPAIFRQQIVEAGIATADEAEGLTFINGVFRGTVRDKTFIAAPLAALPDIGQPLLLHIDCNYFKPLYKGEIKTPLYPLLVETLNAIKTRKWSIAAATVSRSTFGAELPLQTRFIGGQIAEILTEPEMLVRPIPESWAERANALYLENFMQKEKQLEIYEKLAIEDPADPSLKFALYHLSRQFSKGDEALAHLAQAVQIDPVYALEYVALSDLALQKKKPEQAIKMIQLARAARPDDPFFLMLQARTMLNAGDRTDAIPVAAELRALDWSQLYYPEQAEASTQLADLLASGS